ncbi:universal stress protein [Streptomyces sp. NBC_01474]|uniref:universal stress protein n=1 Tax=Streptomyces sp. NBC_01474 TaxID=2903880 RepID=UPI002DDBC7CD|nr:universal stress protein [Streptomyces sp. NBC_01474]WSE00642.1 universal stress protein [Streptomyces sp. NBC_01474]
MDTGARDEIVVGIDPARDWRLPLSWAVDEARRRRYGLRLVAAVLPQHSTHHVDDTPGSMALNQAASDALRAAVAWSRERHTEVESAVELVEGFPAPAMGRMSRQARMIVLGSRHLGRTAEFFSAGSLVVPVTAQAHCPVVVVGDAEHVTQQPPYLVVGIDGSESSKAALGLALEEAALRGAELHAISVWQPPVLLPHDEESAQQAQRRMLSEATAGWSQKYPDVVLRHEVLAGHPVEVLAGAAEHALALVLGRRGRGGYTGMRLGSVVHGLLHRAHCPVITVPVV